MYLFTMVSPISQGHPIFTYGAPLFDTFTSEVPDLHSSSLFNVLVIYGLQTRVYFISLWLISWGNICQKRERSTKTRHFRRHFPLSATTS